MIETIKTKKVYIALLAILFVFVSLSETTYSLFLKSDNTDEFNYNTGLLDLKFLTDEHITLENIFPMNDSDGVKTKPFVLTVKNTGTLTYLFDLKMISSIQDAIDYKYIKVKVNDSLPHSLMDTNNILASNIILYPDEEVTFKINIWLDINLPNSEIGKTFTSKVVTSGSSIYKTIDKSGANHPKMNNNMLAVYYDNSDNTWKKADNSNMTDIYKWYDYNNGMWANSVIINDSNKYVYDITRRNDLNIDNLTVNNGNAVIKNEYINISNNYDYKTISNILRIKFNDLNGNINIISNDDYSYYYDSNRKVFVFKNGNNTAISNEYIIEKDKWYIIGYTYDKSNVSFYIDGVKISDSNVIGKIGLSSFKLGGNSTNITVGDVLFYDRIISSGEFNNNFKDSLNIINDGLVSGYSVFTPMTLKEYYNSSKNGTKILNDDINSAYVWIPRYKYKVWNVMGEKNTDTYNAYSNGIDISFENNTSSSGTIYCENINCYSDILKTTKVTNDDNNKYYTHPAFTNGDNELRGFWVSKYEISNGNQSKPGNNIDSNKNLFTFYNDIKNISNINNYRVIKNTEWGAVAYLSHSKYGLCKNNTCSSIGTNTSNISGSDNNDSTTLNNYGVFDMSGGKNEYVMGLISLDNNMNTYNFNNISVDDYNLYNVDTFILGDATREFTNNGTTYNNSYNWYIRNGLFEYGTSNDIISNNITTRIVTK